MERVTGVINRTLKDGESFQLADAEGKVFHTGGGKGVVVRSGRPGVVLTVFNPEETAARVVAQEAADAVAKEAKQSALDEQLAKLDGAKAALIESAGKQGLSVVVDAGRVTDLKSA